MILKIDNKKSLKSKALRAKLTIDSSLCHPILLTILSVHESKNNLPI
jgi:hypothetical protein